MHSQASADIAGQAVKAVQAVKLECICSPDSQLKIGILTKRTYIRIFSVTKLKLAPFQFLKVRLLSWKFSLSVDPLRFATPTILKRHTTMPSFSYETSFTNEFSSSSSSSSSATGMSRASSVSSEVFTVLNFFLHIYGISFSWTSFSTKASIWATKTRKGFSGVEMFGYFERGGGVISEKYGDEIDDYEKEGNWRSSFLSFVQREFYSPPRISASGNYYPRY